MKLTHYGEVMCLFTCCISKITANQIFMKFSSGLVLHQKLKGNQNYVLLVHRKRALTFYSELIETCGESTLNLSLKVLSHMINCLFKKFVRKVQKAN